MSVTVIGLIGGIASGKSTVSGILQRTPGVVVINGDALGHETYAPDGPAYAPLIELFGPSIVDETTRTINRRALGAIVFGDPAKLQLLNGIVWPAIQTLAEERMLQAHKSQSDLRAIVFEAAVLLEAGWQSMCDEIWCVSVPIEVAVARLKTRNQLTEEDAMKRICAQMSNEEREKSSHRILHNRGTLEELEQHVHQLWEEFTAQPPRPASVVIHDPSDFAAAYVAAAAGDVVDELINDTPAMTKLRGYLNHQMRIKIADLRVLVGTFMCTDAHRNIILGGCSEYLRDRRRYIGLVLVPGKHIISIDVENLTLES